MTGLLFRVDATESVLRSVGDAPHGIVGIVDFYLGDPPPGHALTERFAVVVDPRVQPPPDRGRDNDGGTIVLGDFGDAVPVSYDDALRACTDKEAANMLCSMVVGCATVGFGVAARRVDADHAQAAADAIAALRDTVVRSVNEGWGPR